MYIPDRELDDPIAHEPIYDQFECLECGEICESEFCSNNCYEAYLR